jgi:hypothetical protein
MSSPRSWCSRCNFNRPAVPGSTGVTPRIVIAHVCNGEPCQDGPRTGPAFYRPTRLQQDINLSILLDEIADWPDAAAA